MLKGVSQKVIEVVHTDNRYFEKAILFLRPAAQGEDKAKLKLHAEAVCGRPDTYSRCRAGWCGGRLPVFPAVTPGAPLGQGALLRSEQKNIAPTGWNSVRNMLC